MKSVLIRIAIGLISFVLLLLVAFMVIFSIVNRTNGSIQSRGQTRHYFLYVPETYDPQTPSPLVISIHGFAEWPAHQMDISHWNRLADENGFIVVYPSGTGFPLHWSTNRQSETPEEFEREIQFFQDLINHLETRYAIDPQRIYVNGLSNGAGMSFSLVCSLSDRIAAMGGVAGAYLLPWEECSPGRPVPVIAFHGTADQIVPYEGGPSRSFDVPFPNIPQWITTWAERNNCAASPVEIPTQGEVVGIRYPDCAEYADVVFYTINGGGHSWPGGEPLPEFIVGHTTQDINATRIMWAFFQEHPLNPDH